MSTFPGLIAEINGVSVDRFDLKNQLSRAYFLSHCHSDHMCGLNDNYFKKHHGKKDVYLYASEISSVILKNKYPQLSQNVKVLNFHETHHIVVPGNRQCEDKFISVKVIPAGHCPGSVMFLFTTTEGKNILYTGDFRISSVDLPKLKQLNDEFGKAIIIDKMYFDSTFWDEKFPDFPSRDLSCDVICDIISEWISKGKDYLVSLDICAYYGSEGLYIELSRKLKMKIHVRQEQFITYRHIVELDTIFTEDPNETQIHSCTSIRFGSRTIACRSDTKDLHIRRIKPSAFRWRFFNHRESIFKEEGNGNFFVCYSSHSSMNELKEFVKYFKPKSIEPCVVLQNEKFFKSINTFCEDFLEVLCECPGKKSDTIRTCEEDLTPANEEHKCTIFDSSDDDDIKESEECKQKINSVYSAMHLSKKQNLVINRNNTFF